MKPRRLDELEAMLAAEAFRTWRGDLESVRLEIREAEQRRKTLLDRAFHLELDCEREQKRAIDILEDASDEEAEIAAMIAEESEIENRALEKLAAYEEQRFRASDAWARLGAVEKRLEETRERIEAEKAKGGADASRLDSEQERLVREQRAMHELYERECEKKARLWKEVESLWAKALEIQLLAAEMRCRLARGKRDAERLFRSSDQKQEEARALREEVELVAAKIEELSSRLEGYMALAREQFDAIVGQDFLYFSAADEDKRVWCVSLTRDIETYNVEVEPEAIYRSSSSDGAARIEPLGPSKGAAGADDRIESWFRGKLAAGDTNAAGAEPPGLDEARADKKSEEEKDVVNGSSTEKAAGS